MASRSGEVLGQISLDQVRALSPQGICGFQIGGHIHVPGDALNHSAKIAVSADLLQGQTTSVEVVSDHHDPSQNRVGLVLSIIHASCVPRT